VIFLITFFSIGQLSSPRLIALKGDVEVFRSGADDSVEAQEGMKLRKGDRIIIGSSGMLDLQLKDYYKIRVKEDSKFTIKKLYISRKNTDSIFELSSGTVLIKTQGKFKGSNLEIKTPTALLSAKGTGFLVNVNPQNQSTWLGVLDGTVKVTDYFGFVENELALYVNPTKKIIIEDGRMPKDPQALTELERELLEEINDIGKILVNIILSDTPERVFELFEPLSFYVYGSEPKEVQKLAVEATILLDKAIKEDNDSLYLKSISRLERIVDKHPNPRYNPQFLTFIGAYYEYLDLHEEAIKSFEDILRKYPDSDLASIASCAIAIIYEEKLENTSKAIEFYRKTLSIYPNSLETQMAKEGIKRLSK